MALSTEQLLLLNNFIYGSVSSDQNSAHQTVEMLLDNCGSDVDPRVVEMIRNDPQLCRLTVEHVRPVTETGERSVIFADHATNEAIIAFPGTGGPEWRDNFTAGTASESGNVLSPIQESTVEWVNGLDLSGYSNVTVTGHSKGGNKAKLVALLNDDIDSCISFDGQGFSDEFIAEYADEIARNQGKIENHNVDKDYVNILLNDVGKTTYYDGFNQEGSFANNHQPYAFFDFEHGGNMSIGNQDPSLMQLDMFLNSYLRSLPEEERRNALELFGDLADMFLGTGKELSSEEKMTNILKLFSSGENIGSAKYLLAYLFKYMDNCPEGKDALLHLIGDELGIKPLADAMNAIISVLNNGFIMGLLRGLNMIPAWLRDLLAKWFGLTGGALGAFFSLLNSLLSVLTYYDNIHVVLDNVTDVHIPAFNIEQITANTEVLRSLGSMAGALAQPLDEAASLLSACASECLTLPANLGMPGFPAFLTAALMVPGAGIGTAGLLRAYSRTLRQCADVAAGLRQKLHATAHTFEAAESKMQSDAASMCRIMANIAAAYASAL